MLWNMINYNKLPLSLSFDQLYTLQVKIFILGGRIEDKNCFLRFSYLQSSTPHPDLEVRVWNCPNLGRWVWGCQLWWTCRAIRSIITKKDRKIVKWALVRLARLKRVRPPMLSMLWCSPLRLFLVIWVVSQKIEVQSNLVIRNFLVT